MAASADPPVPVPRRPRLRSVAFVAAGCGVTLIAVLAGVWLSRNAVGERLAVDYLRRRGVPAVVRLTRLDAGGVAGSLTLGAPSAPTLTVERFEAEFAPGTVIAREPRIARLVLVRPRLNLRFDGSRLDFGALQPLVDEALRAPPGKGPAPDVRVEDGRLRLATPYGVVQAEGAADLGAGRLRRADLRLVPAHLRSGAASVAGLGGTFNARQVGADALALQARLIADRIEDGPRRATAVVVTADALAPYRSGAPDPWAGRVSVKVAASAATVDAPGASAKTPTARLDVSGDLSTRGGVAYDGALAGLLRSPELQAGPARLRLAVLSLNLSRLTTGAAPSLEGRAAVSAAGGAATLAGEPATLGPLAVTLTGRAMRKAGLWAGQGRASVDASARLPRSAAARLATRWAPGPYGADLRPALAHSLTDLRLQAPAADVSIAGAVWRGTLAQSVTLAGPGGGLTLAAGAHGQGDGRSVEGALTASARGGGLSEAQVAVSRFRYARGALDARAQAVVKGSAGPLRDAAFALPATIAVDGRGVRVSVAGCGDVAVGRFMGDAGVPLASDVKGRLCPAPHAPLLTAAGGRWSFAGEARGLSLAVPPAKLALAETAAVLRMQGSGERLAGGGVISHALIRDTDAPRRFNPLTVAGSASLARDVWRADLGVALANGDRPLGRLTLTQEMKTGAGALHLDAAGRTFAPEGLQPGAVLPALSTLATEVSGHADIALDLGWRADATTAAAHFVTTDLQGKTVAGLMRGVKTDLRITSLDPLASEPARVTADRLDAVVPLTGLSATYTLGKDVVKVSDARATLAGGRVTIDPLSVGLLPDSTITGVVRANGVQLGELLDAVNLSKAVQIDAQLEGVLPFSLGPQGLRLTDGRLAAMAPGRLTLKREALTGVAASGGEATAVASGPVAAPAPAIPPPQTSAMQDFAFQALEDLAFSELSADVGSRPGGRLGVVFHIKGRHDPPRPAEARVGVLDLLRGKAFDKPIPLPKGTEVNLTLDSSLNMDDLLAAYTGLSKAPGSAQVQP